MWFVGNHLSTFTLMAVAYQIGGLSTAVWTARSRLGPPRLRSAGLDPSGSTDPADGGVDWARPLMLFLAVQGLKAMAVAWKLNKLGLVPRTAADWAPRLGPPPPLLEVAFR